MRKFYTGIGSRETPADVLKLMERFGTKLAGLGWTLRSGGADGADTAFFKGALLHAIFGNDNCWEIYIPWDDFKNKAGVMPAVGVVSLSKASKRLQAESIASRVHPAWDRCSEGARKLHTRNVYQVLGADLSTPSKFLLCWAPVTSDGSPKGGTATAWNIAKEYGVECFNLFFEEDRKRVEKLLEKTK